MSNGLGATVRKQFPHLSGRAFLDKLDERIAEYFPTKTSLKKARGSAVDSTGNVRAGGSSGKKSYDNLPPEANAISWDEFKDTFVYREDGGGASTHNCIIFSTSKQHAFIQFFKRFQTKAVGNCNRHKDLRGLNIHGINITEVHHHTFVTQMF